MSLGRAGRSDGFLGQWRETHEDYRFGISGQGGEEGVGWVTEVEEEH